MSVLEHSARLRDGESLLEGCRRTAIDAVYEARDSGQNMHEAGAAAADAALTLLLRKSLDPQFAWGHQLNTLRHALRVDAGPPVVRQIRVQAHSGVPGSGYGLFPHDYEFIPGHGLCKARRRADADRS